MSIKTYKLATLEALVEEMKRDPSVFLMAEDLHGRGGGFSHYLGLPEMLGGDDSRMLDTPISETAIVSSAIGAALSGMRPVIDMRFSNCLPTCMDEIVNQMAKSRYMFGGQGKVHMVLRCPEGIVKMQGAHHTDCLEAWFAHIPGLVVAMPSTPYDLKGLLKTSIRSNNPVLFVEHKLGYRMKGEVPEEEYTIPFGKADIKREGKDLTIVATSYMVYKALEAAEILQKEDGISVEVIDPRTLVPFDLDTVVKSICKTEHLLIVHEAFERGGIGAEIAAQVANSEAFYHLDAPIERIGGLNVTMPYSHVLERLVVPSPEKIVARVRKMLK